MKNIKLFIFGAAVISLVLSWVPFAYALAAPSDAGNFLNSPVTGVNQAETIFITIVQWIYTIFFIVAVLFLLIAAYNFIRGGSNPEAIKTAKAQLKYAVIAIAIALIASGARFLVADVLGWGGGGGGGGG